MSIATPVPAQNLEAAKELAYDCGYQDFGSDDTELARNNRAANWQQELQSSYLDGWKQAQADWEAT